MPTAMTRFVSTCVALFVLPASLGCARAKPGTFFGKPTVEIWEEEKRDRLVECEHDPDVDSPDDARRCLGAYQTHRGTDACVDSEAWVSRIRDGNEE